MDPKTKADMASGLTIPIELLAPVSSSITEDGDLLNATVSQSVFDKNREIIRKGAEIEGHVFRRRMDGGFAIEIDRINTVNGWQSFYGRLVSLVADVQISSKAANIPTQGVTIIKPASSPEIPAGTSVVWVTQPLNTRVFSSRTLGIAKCVSGRRILMTVMANYYHPA